MLRAAPDASCSPPNLVDLDAELAFEIQELLLFAAEANDLGVELFFAIFSNLSLLVFSLSPGPITRVKLNGSLRLGRGR